MTQIIAVLDPSTGEWLYSAAVGASAPKIASFLGVFPLAAYLLYYAWTIDSGGDHPAIHGWPRINVAALALLGLVVVGLVAHAILALAGFKGRAVDGAYGGRAFRHLQLWTGLVGLAFMIVHAMQVNFGLDVGMAQQRLLETLGQPFYLGMYVAGITALCAHLAIGLSAFAIVWGIARSDSGVLLARAASVLLALAVWGLSINSLALYATGARLL